MTTFVACDTRVYVVFETRTDDGYCGFTTTVDGRAFEFVSPYTDFASAAYDAWERRCLALARRADDPT